MDDQLILIINDYVFNECFVQELRKRVDDAAQYKKERPYCFDYRTGTRKAITRRKDKVKRPRM